MWVKLAGAALVLAAGAGFGFARARSYRRRPQQIRSMIQALQRLETEIVYGATPLPEAFRTLSRQSAEPFCGMFRQAAERLSEPKDDTLSTIWSEAVQGGWRRSSMKPAEMQIVLRLGQTLGLSDRTDQAKHLRLSVLQLQAEETNAAEEQKRYEAMWRSLGVLVGALIVILMY
ncbi:stage III sporulation protein SpoIIIAB [Paenibacillus lutrae]|uniref:Stage III sporulation protein AB n=1 Tax=Paenibacillus lutrae TaxID=2078573 RepID=A0A7X3FIA9_9BACL|nr:stage III sporulation protein SpoIIIAB [Paenibacillus lutrae]MVP00165.1 stage III sporulation protein AB [Paenibacillus lutrae]